LSEATIKERMTEQLRLNIITMKAGYT